MTFAHLSASVIWVAAGVFALLAAASLFVRLMPGKSGGELRARIRSWWVMAAIFASALLLGRMAMLVFLALVSFLALKEYLSLIPTRRADRSVLFWVYLAIPIQFYWVGTEWYGMFSIFIPVYMSLFLPLPMLIKGETQGFLKAIGTLNWGLMATVYSISHAAFLLVLPAEGNPAAGGAGLLLFLVLLTEFNDVAQYIWGRAIGRRPVVPGISPNKTWGGLLGGVVTTSLLSALLAPLLTPVATGPALALGAFLAVAGFAGDVTISAIKRDLGIKDSGSLIPGHGGILDRLDSLTYTAPLFFHIIRYFYY
ncbi:MAG TPA: phosphatidate cytidylyltransferase [Dongiaceae bacterium]|jgi:phosphatidate cytidylyltransferase